MFWIPGHRGTRSRNFEANDRQEGFCDFHRFQAMLCSDVIITFENIAAVMPSADPSVCQARTRPESGHDLALPHCVNPLPSRLVKRPPGVRLLAPDACCVLNRVGPFREAQKPAFCPG